jgi:hypothetical protein
MGLRLGVAREHGLDESMAEKVDHYEESDLPEHQKVALRLADAFVTWPAGISKTLAAQLREYYSPGQIVELLLDISKWSTQKIPVALGTDGEVNPGGLALFDFDAHGKPVFGAALA